MILLRKHGQLHDEDKHFITTTKATVAKGINMKITAKMHKEHGSTIEEKSSYGCCGGVWNEIQADENEMPQKSKKCSHMQTMSTKQNKLLIESKYNVKNS